jgi:putative copper export protein
MSVAYTISVVLHVLAAALWVGGMGLFALVVVPVARRQLGEARARDLLRAAGLRFATVAWFALGVLVVTGVTNLASRGLLPALRQPDFWRSPFGKILALKLTLVALVFGASLVHSRDASRSADRAPSPIAAMLGRVTLLLSLAVVVLAVLLVRGTPW